MRDEACTRTFRSCMRRFVCPKLSSAHSPLGKAMSARSNLDTLVTVFGGSGFLGRHIVRALARRDFRIRVAVRRPDLAGHLQPLGRVGQIHAVHANVRVPGSVEAAVRDASIVINLTGILFQRGKQSFEAVQSEGARNVAAAAAAAGARMVHVSALGADPESASAYARTKAAGEQAVRELVPEATIFRPSVVFGPEDDFFNRFAALARCWSIIPINLSQRLWSDFSRKPQATLGYAPSR